MTATSSGTRIPYSRQTPSTWYARMSLHAIKPNGFGSLRSHAANSLACRIVSCSILTKPARSRRRTVPKHVDAMPKSGKMPHEMPATHFGEGDSGQTAIGEVLQPAFEQVFDGETSNGFLVGNHAGNARARPLRAEDRSSATPNWRMRRIRACVFDASEDAVRTPTTDRGKRDAPSVPSVPNVRSSW